MEKLTLKLVEERLRGIARRENVDLMDENNLWLYTKEYGSLTNEIADVIYPRYGFRGVYPTPKINK